LWHCWGPLTSPGGRNLGFYPKLEIIKERGNLKKFDVRDREYDIIKHSAAFCQHLVLFQPNRKVKTRIYLKMT